LLVHPAPWFDVAGTVLVGVAAVGARVSVTARRIG